MKKTVLLFFILGNCVALHAQQACVNSGNLKIFSGTSVSTFGNFTNLSTSSFVNDGNFFVKAHLINDQPSVNAGTGTLYFNGSAAQAVNGSQKFNTYHLETNNASGITLNNNLSINGVHTFTAGIISTSSTPNYLVYESGSSYSGAANNKHVNGWVRKIGSSDFTFPTGDGTYLREVDILNLSTGSEFDARYNGSILVSERTTQSPLVSVNPNEYWTINRNSGGSVQVKLNWDNSKVAFPNYVVSDLRTSWYSGSAWTNTGGTATGNTATTGNITSDALNSFGRFAIASTSFVIPLKFLAITARRENSSVKVNWQTANEVAVNFYEVQRSVDGYHFISIGNVAAKNEDLQSYLFSDLNAPAVKLFYRIKAKDLDGSVRYSRIASVLANDQSTGIELLTNPVRSSIQLATHDLPSSLYSYQLINTAGQVCKKGIFTCEGTSVVSIPVSIVPGAYTLIISNSKEQQQFKLVVQ